MEDARNGEWRPERGSELVFWAVTIAVAAAIVAWIV